MAVIRKLRLAITGDSGQQPILRRGREAGRGRGRYSKITTHSKIKTHSKIMTDSKITTKPLFHSKIATQAPMIIRKLRLGLRNHLKITTLNRGAFEN